MIKPLRYYTQKVLPLVYDDSLSYYEVLGKTTTKLNEVIVEMNNLTENIDKLIEARIENALDEFKKIIDAEIAEVNNSIDLINAKIIELDGDINHDRELINALRTDFNNLEARLTNELQALTRRVNQIEIDYKLADDRLYAYIIRQVAELREEIQHIVLSDVTVTNPVTGQVDTIQNTLDDIYRVVTLWALTASEYDALGLSANGYDGAGLTAEQYDYLGRYYLAEKPDIIARCNDYTDNEVATLGDVVYTLRDEFDSCCDEVQTEIANNAVMFSPFRGVEETVKQVVYELAELARAEAVTAEYYDNLEMTATDYDDRRISAFNYDWHASAYLI